MDQGEDEAEDGRWAAVGERSEEGVRRKRDGGDESVTMMERVLWSGKGYFGGGGTNCVAMGRLLLK